MLWGLFRVSKSVQAQNDRTLPPSFTILIVSYDKGFRKDVINVIRAIASVNFGANLAIQKSPGVLVMQPGSSTV